MEQLIIQAIAGIAGGNGAAAAKPDLSLGKVGNSIAGLLGGIGGGSLLSMLVSSGAEMAAGGGLDIGGIVTQLLGGAGGGAIVTAVIGLIKSKMA